MPGALSQILDALRVAKKASAPIKDAYNAGYRNLVYRAVGNIDDPALHPRINANVGTHADFVGGRQADDIQAHMTNAGLPNPGVLTLLARMKKPVFMTDTEVNDPMFMANALHDRQLAKEVNWAQFRYPEHMIDAPGVGGYDDVQIPLSRVLNRRAAERALRRRGYDSVIYPNEIEGMLSEFDPRFVSSDVLSSLAKREDLARAMVENNPVPSYDSFMMRALNPSMTTLDDAGYRLPFGALTAKRDFTSKGYATGGAACRGH